MLCTFALLHYLLLINNNHFFFDGTTKLCFLNRFNAYICSAYTGLLYNRKYKCNGK